MSAASENTVMPENLSNNPSSEEPASTKPHTNNEMVCAEAQTSNELLVAELQTKAPLNLQPLNEDRRVTTDECVAEEIAVKPEPKDEEMQEEVKVKEELEADNSTSIEYAKQYQKMEETSLVGKLKIKPMASLVETTPPNPQPGLHPFFAGFDDHIRSLIMNRQPQFTMNSPLIQRPNRFMYYDNSTNMNLKKMLNGHKMAPVSRHPTYRPYVPINVPRPPRSRVPFRTSFSTQTPPMVIGGQPEVSATPSTSYQWLPQSRPPVPNINSENSLPAQSTSLKNLSVPNFIPANNAHSAKFIHPQNLTAPNFAALGKLSAPSFPSLHNSPVPNVAPLPPSKVSTSSSTDDLEKHSSENIVTIKTEVDLGIDSIEDIKPTLDECNDMGTHFMETSEPTIETSDTATSNLETDATPQKLMLTGDVVTPIREEPKRSPEFDLPVYSTKGLLLCKCCDFRCSRKKKMKEHFDTMHTAENHYKCFYCIKKLLPTTFKTVHDLEHHVGKVHRKEKRWQCKCCSKTYKCQASYKAHMEKTCSQSHPYACHMCTFTCLTEVSLEKHIRGHEKVQETLECPFCNKYFKRFYLKQHLITVHAPPEEKPFHCKTCDFAAGTQQVLDSHNRRTGHDKQFKCDKCDYACRSESIMKNHVHTVHDKDHPDKLICGLDGCKVTCKNKRNIEAHRRIHSMPDSELVVCPDKECLQKFTTEQSLRYHINKTQHHKPFKCPDCSVRFLKDESVNKHIQSIHVTKIMKKMSQGLPEPMRVKNVVDVYNHVERGGAGGTSSIETPQSEMYDEEENVTSFGCWLGISGFGDALDKTDCDNQAPSQANISEVNSENEVSQEKKMEDEEEEDEDYRNLVPVTCLVELEQEETEDISNSSVGKADNEESLFLVKKEEEENEDDSDYQNVNPELSGFVECQQNAMMESSTETYTANEPQETDCLPANLVKIEVDERDAS